MKSKKLILVGLSFVVALFVFFWGFNFLKGRDIFNRERIFFVEYREVSGLITSNPVLIRGFRVGQVKDIYFHPSMDGRLVVEISVTDKVPIPRNSIAKIYSSDLMGSKAIELILGNSTSMAMHNDTLLSAVEASLMEEVNAQVLPLKNKAESLLSSVDSLVTIVQALINENIKQNLTQSLQSITRTIRNLENTTGNIDNIVNQQQSRIAAILYNIEMISRNIEQSNSNITRTIQNLTSLTDSLAKADIVSAVRHADSSIVQLNKLMQGINTGQGTMGQLMQNDTLYRKLESSAEELRRLLEDVRLNPKRYVKVSVF
ncbi:MAG TPA: MlaD family protein [Bacteroidales bacterium]|nr:MlaD family protein [Bacteroidales bacterium]